MAAARSKSRSRSPRSKKAAVASIQDDSEPSTGKDDEPHEGYEFGGPLGAVGLMIFSHLILYYLWIAWRHNDAALWNPLNVDKWALHMADAVPNLEACLVYGAFFVGQVLMTWLIPGTHVKVSALRRSACWSCLCMSLCLSVCLSRLVLSSLV